MFWQNALGIQGESVLAGIALRGARAKEGLAQRELSTISGIPQGHIYQMENGKRDIGKTTAQKLGEALGVSYKIFL